MGTFRRLLEQSKNLRSNRAAAITLRALAIGGALALGVGYAHADSETEARYPYDPACPWGRVANGQGMLKRCVSESEAKRLIEGPAAGAACTPTSSAPTTSSSGAAAAEPVTPPSKPEPAAPKGVRPFQLKLASIVAEEGEIGFGKLTKAMDRYRKCVEDNGGLTAAKAQVTLSFLVRAELARAEGVEVKKVSGTTQEVARCLADVVDRRATGAPASAMTGVTLTFEMNETK